MGIPLVMSDADRAILANSEAFKALESSEGFKLFVQKIETVQAQAWLALLQETPETIQRAQGWIEGVNFVLGVCRAEIQNGQRILDEHRRAEERALEASRAAEEFQSQRIGRRSRLGASLE
jgi:hypothetical protein